MDNIVNIINAAMLYMKVKRVNPEFSSQGKDTFFSYSFHFVSIWNDGCSLSFRDNHFMMLYTLNLCSAACQLYLNKTGRK